ncbi:MAG TPA: DUF4304 domain-containing protein [Verrucomicrobiota bacterium]|nr:hypothetical protein [Verrucomicrobiales bacterium]HRI15228.1 DUF4304 domain-containing protein [Verrucomicrobiota bacterium]
MSAATPRLEVSIRAHLFPQLKEDGFSGSGRTFRRVISGSIQVVNVQGSRDSGQFAINLGIQPVSVPDVLGNVPDSKKITESLCEFGRRLAEAGEDQWWDYGLSQESMDVAVLRAAGVYVRVGRPLLAQLGGGNSPLSLVSPEDFDQGKIDLLGFGHASARLALVFARMRKAEGRLAESRAFAAYGLAHLGRATLLRAELEKLGQT